MTAPKGTRARGLRRILTVGWAVVAAAAVALSGCATPHPHKPHAYDRGSVSHSVEARFGTAAGLGGRSDGVLVPTALDEGHPLSEEQAVVLALWNNALFHEALVELDLTRADLIQAGLLPNPEFAYWWPVPDKVFKYLFDFPIESLYLRPLRVKAAAAENERAAARLTQLALDLIRDTRLAYSDLHLARDRVKVAERALAVRERILELAELRLKDGVATPFEVSTARIDALRAAQDLVPVRQEVTVAGERLRNFTGLSGFTFPLVPDDAPFDPRLEFPVEELVAEAVATRPDAVAAEHAARAAAERLRVARIGWIRLLGIGDATSGLKRDHEFGPGLRMTVPIFNHGQGLIARADAELEQLERRRQTVQNQIVMDVRTAHARYLQARTELDFLRGKTRPEVEVALRRAEAAYKEGNTTYLIVLETNRQLIDTYAREAQLSADLRRAWAELERAVGRRLTAGLCDAPPKPAPGTTP
jgi:outer membrane protein, heavy metal efflux system